MKLMEVMQQPMDARKTALYNSWRKLTNMSASDLAKFKAGQTAAAKADPGKYPGLKPAVAKSIGISSGVQSAEWIMKMKDKGVRDWTPEMWKWCGKQVSFISRMLGNSGPMFDEKGRPTRKLLSLLIWGHNPTNKSIAAILKAGDNQ